MLYINFHIFELKFRFFYVFLSFFLTFVFSYIYAEKLMYLYVLPFLKIQLLSHKILLTNFIFTDLSEPFYSYVYISTFISIYFSFLIFLYNFFSYLKMGLFFYEKQLLGKFLTFFFIYINLVFILISHFILPTFLNFFLSFEKPGLGKFFSIRFEAKLFDYIILNNKLIFSSLLIFLIPFFIFLLLELKIISTQLLKTNRRIFILFFFILGAIFSPPDLYSQILIALPLFCCFELIIFFSYLKKVYFLKLE